MKTLNVGKILLLCAFVIGLASCGDDVYYTMAVSYTHLTLPTNSRV